VAEAGLAYALFVAGMVLGLVLRFAVAARLVDIPAPTKDLLPIDRRCSANQMPNKGMIATELGSVW